MDEDTEVSYLREALVICEDILDNQEGERKRDKDRETGEPLPEGVGHGDNNIRFAIANVERFRNLIKVKSNETVEA